MSMTQSVHNSNPFQEHELVTWHYQDKGNDIPVPGVVVRQESNSVVIKARVQGALQELRVDPRQLFHR